MNYRYMRVLVLFDLPTFTKHDRREATRFRNFLLNDGYDMLQYSVYARLCPNRDNAEVHLTRCRKAAPDTGSVRFLMVTENQYANMKVLVGEKTAQEQASQCQQLSFF